MKIQILVHTKKIQSFYLEAISEYKKRLSRYCKVSLSEHKTLSNLHKKIPQNAYIINLSVSGENLSSESLAKKINQYAIQGNSNIAIIINAPDVLASENWTITKMTMDEGLTTTILFEQIYRAYRIINNQAYHK